MSARTDFCERSLSRRKEEEEKVGGGEAREEREREERRKKETGRKVFAFGEDRVDIDFRENVRRLARVAEYCRDE